MFHNYWIIHDFHSLSFLYIIFFWSKSFNFFIFYFIKFATTLIQSLPLSLGLHLSAVGTWWKNEAHAQCVSVKRIEPSWIAIPNARQA